MSHKLNRAFGFVCQNDFVIAGHNLPMEVCRLD